MKTKIADRVDDEDDANEPVAAMRGRPQSRRRRRRRRHLLCRQYQANGESLVDSDSRASDRRNDYELQEVEEEGEGEEAK